MQSKIKWLALLAVVAMLMVLMTGMALAAPAADTDGDGISDDLEAPFAAVCYQYDKFDTDGDTIGDGAELTAGTNPCSKDSDNDGLNDDVETDTGLFVDLNDTGTDPMNPDTDGDGIPDGYEAGKALQCGNMKPTDPTDANIDDDSANPGLQSDGLSNKQEYMGWDGNNNPTGFGPTDPCNRDGDKDGMMDGTEVNKAFGVVTNPWDPDTDDDGLCDGTEWNTNQWLPKIARPVEAAAIVGGGSVWLLPPGTLPGSVATNICKTQLDFTDLKGDFGSNPTVKDSDGDTVPDGVEASGGLNWWPIAVPTAPVLPEVPGYMSDPNVKDTDGDSLDDNTELLYTGKYGANMDPTHIDTDGDGMPDWYEFARTTCGFGGLDPTYNDGKGDVDGDGLTNIQEYKADPMAGPLAPAPTKFDACKVDTDADGMNDGWEYYFSIGAGGKCMDPSKNDTAADVDVVGVKKNPDGASNLLEYLGPERRGTRQAPGPGPGCGQVLLPAPGRLHQPLQPGHRR